MERLINQDTFKVKKGHLELEQRSRAEWGRHGGGWNYKLGFQGGDKIVIFNLGTMSLRVLARGEVIQEIIETEDWVVEAYLWDLKIDQNVWITQDRYRIDIVGDYFRVNLRYKHRTGWRWSIWNWIEKNLLSKYRHESKLQKS